MKYLLGTETVEAEEITGVDTVYQNVDSFDGYILHCKSGSMHRIHPEQWESIIPSVGDIYVVQASGNFNILPPEIFYADYKLIEE